jgi:hypothetical protein
MLHFIFRVLIPILVCFSCLVLLWAAPWVEISTHPVLGIALCLLVLGPTAYHLSTHPALYYAYHWTPTYNGLDHLTLWLCALAAHQPLFSAASLLDLLDRYAARWARDLALEECLSTRRARQ